MRRAATPKLIAPVLEPQLTFDGGGPAEDGGRRGRGLEGTPNRRSPGSGFGFSTSAIGCAPDAAHGPKIHDRNMRSAAGIDLYWLPLGAGGRSVRLNGQVFE